MRHTMFESIQFQNPSERREEKNLSPYGNPNPHHPARNPYRGSITEKEKQEMNGSP
jgi:hypothetical protein